MTWWTVYFNISLQTHRLLNTVGIHTHHLKNLFTIHSTRLFEEKICPFHLWPVICDIRKLTCKPKATLEDFCTVGSQCAKVQRTMQHYTIHKILCSLTGLCVRARIGVGVSDRKQWARTTY